MVDNILVDIVGWLGVVTLLIAYVLVSTKRIEGDSVVYQVMNLVGAALLIVNSSYYGAFPSVGVNVIWVGIAVYTLVSRKKPV